MDEKISTLNRRNRRLLKAENYYLPRSLLTVLFLVTAFIHHGTSQVNTSLALVWSTKLAVDSRGSILFLYGDPNSYRDRLQRNETFNGSSSTSSITKKNSLSSYSALETDTAASKIFFSESSAVVGYASADGNKISTIQTTAFSESVTGLAFDWVSKLIYWSDAVYQRIGMVGTERNNLLWRPVVESGLTSPQDVAVYPQRGFLFWTDWSPKIERLDLASGIRQVIISNGNTGLQRPTALVMDFITQRLIWLDSSASRIGSVHLSGSDYTEWTTDLFSGISSFVLFSGYIFLGDKMRPTAYVYNYTQKAYVGNVITEAHTTGIIDMTVFAPEKQPSVTSPCNVDNGRCSHFCITRNSTTRICQCAMGFLLDSDGASCSTGVLEDNFLLVADRLQQNVFQVDLGTGVVRAATATPVDFFKVTAVDYDPVTKSVYGVDSAKYSIRKFSLTNKTFSTVVQFQGSEIKDLAVDTVGRMLYYIDYTLGTIVRSTLSGDNPETLFLESSVPTALTLDVKNRILFWSDCSVNRRTIEQASMLNLSTHQPVTSFVGLCASAIATDCSRQLIFWGDSSGRIEQVSYDGSGRVLIQQLSTSAVFQGLAVDTDFIYISDSTQRQIQKINRNTYRVANLTGMRFTNPYAIAIYRSVASTFPTSPTSSTRKSSTESATVSESTSSTSPSWKNKYHSTLVVILASVICGSVVVIAAIVTLGIVLSRRCKEKPNSSDGRINKPTKSTADMSAEDNEGYETLGGDGKNVYTSSEIPPWKDGKYESLIPDYPTYTELIETDRGLPVPPPRSSEIIPGRSDYNLKVPAPPHSD